jgi:hypothetical protein
MKTNGRNKKKTNGRTKKQLNTLAVLNIKH